MCNSLAKYHVCGNVLYKLHTQFLCLLQYFERDYIVYMTSCYLLPFIHKCHVTLSVSVYNRLTTLDREC